LAVDLPLSGEVGARGAPTALSEDLSSVARLQSHAPIT